MKTAAHKRYRTKDGTICPGCTTVCALLAKPQLIVWANRLGLDGVDSAKYTDDKADIGVLAHSFITDKLQGFETDTSDYSENQIQQARSCVRSYESWAQGRAIEAIFIEESLVSEEFRYGGTLDLYAEIDGTKELIDFKSGNGIWPEAIIQVSAYRQLLIEAGHEVEQCRILNIPRAETESFQELLPSETVLDLNFELFRHLLGIYEIRRQLK